MCGVSWLCYITCFYFFVCILLLFFVFFFSSRRRHTRCLSDLEFRRVLFRSRRGRAEERVMTRPKPISPEQKRIANQKKFWDDRYAACRRGDGSYEWSDVVRVVLDRAKAAEIGRASCRERVEISVEAEALTKK